MSGAFLPRGGRRPYWVLEIDSTVTLSAGRLVDGAYDSDFEGGGEFKATSPFTLTIDLPSLASRGAIRVRTRRARCRRVGGRCGGGG